MALIPRPPRARPSRAGTPYRPRPPGADPRAGGNDPAGADPNAAASATPAERLRALRQAPPTPAIGTGRLWRRMLIVCVLVVAVVLFQRGRFQAISDRVFGAGIDWHNDYAMTSWLYEAIEHRHLTDVRRACLLLNIHGGDPVTATHLDVYERPTEACMGPAHDKIRFLPRLFGFLVDRDTGAVRTDQGSPGTYHALPWF